MEQKSLAVFNLMFCLLSLVSKRCELTLGPHHAVCVCMCVSLSFQVLNQLTDCHKMLCGYRITVVHSNIIAYILRQ
jgi:hypothetical protein